ncbi:MAG: GcrA family cell cycle regulator [Paracoccaceae bacterium]
MGWDDDRVERLRAMWNDGMSASRIAKELGGVTRNAVIGKVHRLGLSNRTPAGQHSETESPMTEGEETKAEAPDPEVVAGDDEEEAPPPSRSAPAVRDASKPRPPGQPTPEEESARETLAEIEKIAKRLSLLELTERTCKWPIGDPNDDDFHFCGLPAVSGKPYCEHHVGVAFQPMSSRRDRRR